jgi:hypothetical protein
MQIYDDISTRATPQNAITLYAKLSLNSIREIPQYPTPHPKDIHVEVDARKSNISVSRLKRYPLDVELLTSDTKIPEIIRHIEGPTIIYTESVTGIDPKLSKAVEDDGYSMHCI